MAAMILTAFVTFFVASATAFFGFMAWLLALNGFMGRPNIVNISMAAYIVLAVLVVIAVTGLSVLTVYRLSGRGWNGVLAAAFSCLLFCVAAGIAHSACVVISALIAGMLV